MKASQYLRRKRLECIWILLPDDIFGDFHLFIAARGKAKMHKDRNDYLAFLFLVSAKTGQGGGLEIGGTGHSFEWKVGDAILLDSADLFHGTRQYLGDSEERVVGIFIIHKNYLIINGIEI